MNQIPTKTFNIAGPCNPNKHYMLPAVERIPNLNNLFLTESYFVLHAPRQSGKTTAIKALVKTINEEAEFYALYCSFESLERISNLASALASINYKLIEYMAESGLKSLSESYKGIPEFDPNNPLGLSSSGLMGEELPKIGNVISFTLKKICQKLDKDLLIFVDEIDTLSGDVLVSFLRQLREGYINRNTDPFPPFPRSIALVGMRNIRDYKDQVRPDSETLGTSSPFNIITEALTL
ncbi:MAG: ATP-binding protein, partial [Lactobacillales bacterium]|nr:ATP-binding protein [Lactobacillales bacterium]